jgi:hypothetical protein
MKLRSVSLDNRCGRTVARLAWCVLIVACALTMNGCCSWRARRYGTVLGTFEQYVIVGYDVNPHCPTPKEGIPRLVAPTEPLRVWVRAVYRDHVDRPVPDVFVSVGLVNSFGDDIPANTPEFSIRPDTVKTLKDGYSSAPIIFTTSQQGHYRIKATYKDKNAQGVSYGPLVIVQH